MVERFLTFLPDKLVVDICTCGPIGRLGKAPGTNGSLLGLGLYTLLFHQLILIWQVLLILPFVYFSILICSEGEKRLHKKDPGEMIIDEVVAIPICFMGMGTLMESTGHVWAYMIAGFVLFRVFDILKPFGIKKLQDYPSGVGVVLDDLAAAIATNVVIHVSVLYLPLLLK